MVLLLLVLLLLLILLLLLPARASAIDYTEANQLIAAGNVSSFIKTTDSYQAGAKTMPREYYASPEVFARERDRVFARHWICVGRKTDFQQPGAYRLADVAGESLIIVRDRSCEIRAHFNVCRHRGTRLCTASQGTFSETIQCPYHAWTYRLDGRLIGAPHMQATADFSVTDYPLHSAHVDEWEGFLFVNLSANPQPLASSFAPVYEKFARFNLPSLVSVRRIDYDVRTNWKLIMQNYSECLHCPTIHPELTNKLPYTSGANDLTEGPFLGGYMEIKAPNESATMSGRACAIPLGDLPDEDRSRAFYYTLFPNMMLSLHPDYAVYYTVTPRSATESLVTCDWMVHPDAPSKPGYNIVDAEEFWDRTNRQDWHICEQSQLGVMSRVYTPGPYSPRESVPAAWDREYLQVLDDSSV